MAETHGVAIGYVIIPVTCKLRKRLNLWFVDLLHGYVYSRCYSRMVIVPFPIVKC